MPKNFEIYSDDFQRILGPSPELKLLSSDLKFAEGVCWVERSGFLIVSDFLNDRIMKWSERDGLGVFRQPAQTANGNTVDLEGRVVSCTTRGRSVVRQEHGWFWIRRGEQRICVGCHTGPERSSENRVPGVLLHTTTPVDLSGANVNGAAQQKSAGGN